MSNKGIEDKFSKEIDAYFNGIENKNKIQSTEYNDLLEIGKSLADKDFSRDSNKQVVFNKTLKRINENEGENIMKKSNKFKKAAIAVASIGIVSVSLMQTSFAQEVADKIIRTISLGHYTVLQTESPKIKEMKIPDELKGKIFDKNGKLIEVVTEENARELYTAKGEKIDHTDKGKIITVAEQEKIEKEITFEVKNINEINKYTCFEVKLPTYLPAGYNFERAEFYKDKNETEPKDSKYVNLYFTNKETEKFIYMQQRFPDESTKCVGGADKVDEVKINGINAVIEDDRAIHWETKKAVYSLSGRGEITKSDLIKIAESIK